MSKKTPLRKETVEKFTKFLIHVQEELPKNSGLPLYKLTTQYKISTYAATVLVEDKYIQRLGPGHHILKHLKFSERDIDTIIRSVQSRQRDNYKNQQEKKKQDKERKVLVEKQKEKIETIQEEQVIKEKAKEEAPAREVIYADPQFDRNLELEKENHKLKVQVIEKDQEITKLKEEVEIMRNYYLHVMKREANQLYTIDKMNKVNA